MALNGVANPGPVGHFWPTRVFGMALGGLPIESE